MSMESAPEGAVSPRADLLAALVWLAFGTAVTIGAWRMDRLEHLHINQYEIPGLVPMLLGAAMVLLGLVLVGRAIARGGLRAGAAPPDTPENAGSRRHIGIVIGAMLAYSVGLVGHGIPFWLATLLFVWAFIFFFDRERQQSLGRGPLRQALLAFIYGAATSAVVTLVFQDIFYVRLP